MKRKAPLFKWTVYALSDPQLNVYRYIGVTSSLKTRTAFHIKGNASPKMWRWSYDMSRLGLSPKVSVLAVVKAANIYGAMPTEGRWIRDMAAEGHPLMNVNNARNKGANSKMACVLYDIVLADRLAIAERAAAAGEGGAK